MKKNEQDKRKFKRFLLPVAHYQGRDDKGVRGIGDVRDVSREGFCILSPSTLKKGSVLEFKINVTEVLDFRCVAEVCWSEAIGSHHLTGFVFTRIDPDDKAKFLDYAYQAWVRGEGRKKDGRSSKRSSAS